MVEKAVSIGEDHETETIVIDYLSDDEEEKEEEEEEEEEED